MKSKAHADRWHEEVQLVREEMWRVLAFLEWKAVWWAKEGGRNLDVRPDIADGIRADEPRSQQREKSLLNSKRVGMQVEGV